MTDIILLTTSIASFGGIIYLVSRKIPFLMAIPENIINESFVTKPSKIKVAIERIRGYFIEKKYEIPILAFVEWFLRRIRVSFLKFEHLSFRFLKFIQERKRILKIPKAKREYLESLKNGQTENKNG
ncbi:MAG: hypothetical protein A3G49_01835 [Candidatus Sungbacteria bacterium RIFCSPLOWO2_12_FULL_41_11]|uniref:Uncharacterized protein n=1 Tax=Candidatus Sungbacteria bacterium RIFCSPLOWO2_12_FULL_41_11 TaxID=1802286 RepID=A0A1G2LRT3_9BACT|nr:MAG: hypothetical protein A3D41_00705 [Candidatus Sungbacteria bacterium RIFCSPHIGHO2_02_FULL_41_12b]OHA14350.1 MAG: hypothetical protein A3G49_01835 [Candidatus Sungbacteria bacterium RIFCSPLOWO2_12_FULL_41_11]